MTKYWETERPTTISTPKNVLQFYPQAGKLSVVRPNWTDDAGVAKQGKTVVCDLSALMEAGPEELHAARGVFAAVVRQIDERLDVLPGKET